MKEYTLNGMAAMVILLAETYNFPYSKIGAICVELARHGNVHIFGRAAKQDYSIVARYADESKTGINVKINELVV